jgi:putative transposase
MYNPLIHNRQSRRLKGYDYASQGLYFVTLNTENRNKLFGEIKIGVLHLNEAGLIVQNCWLAIPKHFPHVTIHEFVIMPDHIHGIIEIIYNPNIIVGAKNFSPRLSEFISPTKTIGSIVRGFKIGVTKWMRQHTTVQNIWQRDYHDHIIRDTDSYERICQYIRDNPKNWKEE